MRSRRTSHRVASSFASLSTLLGRGQVALRTSAPGLLSTWTRIVHVRLVPC
ncbi:hypothetical protein PF003_g30879 [Phytophthora fragariae]|nr:hypothetical protein PF003_g30879 [Phytophthora fragariae]